MDKQLENYKRRYSRARGESFNWWPMLESAYHYCIPNRNLFYYPDQNKAAQKNIKVYDTTQIAATKNFVSKAHNSFTPPQQTWAFYDASDAMEDQEREGMRQMLQKFTDVTFNYIHQSNFDTIINECYYDLAVGTSVLVISEGDDSNPLQCSSIPLDQVAIEESANHQCETCFRTWGEIRLDDIPNLWPRAKPTSMMEQAYKQDPNATVTNIIEAAIHNPGNVIAPYTYVVWHNDEMLLHESQESPPFIIFRWSKVNSETYGRGPIIDALPSIFSLQTAAYFEMTAANLNICKPYMAYSDGIFNPFTFQMSPNSVIPVAPNSNGQWPISALPDVANPNFMQLTTIDLRQQINKLMYSNPLGDIHESPTRTATELSLRQSNLAEEIGPLFTRLQQEFLDKVIDRVTYILAKKGLLPASLRAERGVKVRYKSPLTISQGQQDVISFQNYMQTMQQISGPEVALTTIDTTRLPSWIAEKLGVDASLVNTQEQMQQQYQMQQEQQDQQQEMETMAQAQQLEGGGAAGA